ncbi:MAG: dihydropteroate synthase [Prevotella sp.]|nr:dihydropteroate synthase [Prevotella sp.]
MDYTLNIHGRLMELRKPVVMGILNATPDSFFEGSRLRTEAEIARRANQIVAEGGSIIDVGAYSTRPGAVKVSLDEEMERMRHALTVVRREQPDAVLSVDTFRPEVARMAVEEYGVGIINDVSGGNADGSFGGTTQLQRSGEDEVPEIFHEVARLQVPYILMSSDATLRSMLLFFSFRVQQLRALGQKDIIIDPGFGFGKSVEQNFSLMGDLEKLQVMGLPILVGVSRKSMIWKTLELTPNEALNGTTMLNTIALQKGAGILRVHDVREAAEVIKLSEALAMSSSRKQNAND